MITITRSESGLKNYTVEEYLDFEASAEERHEYNDGEIVTMTGGTPNHNNLASNLMVVLKMGLRGQPFSCFITDQRLWIPQLNKFTYPDVMVLAQPVDLLTGRSDTVVNPLLIAEVLSLGTRSYDKDAKFAAYRSIASFQEYLLIDQYTVCVEHYAKADDQQRWIFREYKDLGDRIILSTIPVEVSLADLYEDIQL
ncbi:MAG: Uma2 family endonuclease [Pseudanabaenaceae cyanobacterium bins.39]|nr:Uma2 family endonuclease [Pseudanabaenaceae cyanobacterium bins.39]